MTGDEFLNLLSREVETYASFLQTTDKEWIVKGFIDIDSKIHPITLDTKVVSKIIELQLIPRLEEFAHRNGMGLEFPSKQNFYPDLTFRDSDECLFAVDFKSSYYVGNRVNGLTLGSYWGYFRERDKLKNMDHTYNSYSAHIVLGVLYKQYDNSSNERRGLSLNELKSIPSVIGDFISFVQPKWKIASDIPGSGNTRNIGGITDIEKLINGKGPFAEYGEDVFDSYWKGYYNISDAQAAGIGPPPYSNLKTYQEYLDEYEESLKKFD